MINKTEDPPINDQLKPDKNNTNNPDNMTINAVPRSGCLATRKNEIIITINDMRTSLGCIGNFLSPRKVAKKIGRANLSNSED